MTTYNSRQCKQNLHNQAITGLPYATVNEYKINNKKKTLVILT